MKTSRIKILVMVVFVLTLGAGVVAGLLAARLPTSPPKSDSSGGGSPLETELSLTPDQREKMKAIWIGVQSITQESLEQSLKAENERDRGIDALIPADRIDAYNTIKRNYAETNAKLKGRRDAAFDKAVAETKEKILTPAQREKYEKILKKRLGTEVGGSHDPLTKPEAVGQAPPSMLQTPRPDFAETHVPGT
jgi:Spy/CpxP family protein refolding chaperone